MAETAGESESEVEPEDGTELCSVVIQLSQLRSASRGGTKKVVS